MKSYKEKEADWFFNRLVRAGLTFIKKVRKGSGTSGAIYLPKHLIGKTVKIIVIPLSADEEELIDPKKLLGKKRADIDSLEMDIMKEKIKRLESQIKEKEPIAPINTTKGIEQREKLRNELFERAEKEEADERNIIKIDTERKE